jgi:hypothetical protein
MNLMTDKEISPAACAVLDAAFNASTWGRDDCLNDAREIAAAVLRAAADQVVPVEPEPPELPFASVNDPWPSWNAKQNIRHQLLAIAAEL